MRGIIWIDVDANSYGILLRLKIDGNAGAVICLCQSFGLSLFDGILAG